MLRCIMRRLMPFLIFLASLLFSARTEASLPKRDFSNFGAFKGALATENGLWANDTYTVHRLSSRLVDYTTLEELNASGSPTTRTWTFDYDSLNRLSELSGGAGTFTFDYAGPASRLVATHLPGGNVSITNFFDPAGQLLERSMRTAGGVLDYFGYTHDLTGLRTNVVRADNTHVEYLFDGIGHPSHTRGDHRDGAQTGPYPLSPLQIPPSVQTQSLKSSNKRKKKCNAANSPASTIPPPSWASNSSQFSEQIRRLIRRPHNSDA